MEFNVNYLSMFACLLFDTIDNVMVMSFNNEKLDLDLQINDYERKETLKICAIYI